MKQLGLKTDNCHVPMEHEKQFLTSYASSFLFLIQSKFHIIGRTLRTDVQSVYPETSENLFYENWEKVH